jgi:opacity protein-like surface antigen
MTANLKLESLYGLYAKVKSELMPGLEAFGRAGYSSASNKFTLSNGYTESRTSDGFSWGMGAAYSVSPSVAATFDYMSYSTKEDAKASGYTFGVQFKF